MLRPLLPQERTPVPGEEKAGWFPVFGLDSENYLK
jgi:hypothetical protein